MTGGVQTDAAVIAAGVAAILVRVQPGHLPCPQRYGRGDGRWAVRALRVDSLGAVRGQRRSTKILHNAGSMRRGLEPGTCGLMPCALPAALHLPQPRPHPLPSFHPCYAQHLLRERGRGRSWSRCWGLGRDRDELLRPEGGRRGGRGGVSIGEVPHARACVRTHASARDPWCPTDGSTLRFGLRAYVPWAAYACVGVLWCFIWN